MKEYNEEDEQDDNDIDENLVKVLPSNDISKKIKDHIKLNVQKLFYDMVSKQVIYIGKSFIYRIIAPFCHYFFIFIFKLHIATVC